MAHEAQREFCREVKRRFPGAFCNSRVLEIGPRNINGSVRAEFDQCAIVGVDCTARPGVDVVCCGHEYDAEAESFDVVCSTETLEHDPFADQTVSRMLRLLRAGGLFFMTCAGEGREEHGTARTGHCYGPQPEFYRNVTLAQFIEWMTAAGAEVQELYVRHDACHHDLYAFAVKR